MAKRPRDEAPPCAAASLPAVRTLARAAAANAPDPHYLDDIPGRSPLLTTRQREKVVKYINEVSPRARTWAFRAPRGVPDQPSKPLDPAARRARVAHPPLFFLQTRSGKGIFLHPSSPL